MSAVCSLWAVEAIPQKKLEGLGRCLSGLSSEPRTAPLTHCQGAPHAVETADVSPRMPGSTELSPMQLQLALEASHPMPSPLTLCPSPPLAEALPARLDPLPGITLYKGAGKPFAKQVKSPQWLHSEHHIKPPGCRVLHSPRVGLSSAPPSPLLAFLLPC